MSTVTVRVEGSTEPIELEIPHEGASWYEVLCNARDKGQIEVTFDETTQVGRGVLSINQLSDPRGWILSHKLKHSNPFSLDVASPGDEVYFFESPTVDEPPAA